MTSGVNYISRAGERRGCGGVSSTPASAAPRSDSMDPMVGLVIILAVVGIVLLLLGVFVEAAKFLLWVGAVILLIALIAWLMKVFRRNA